MKKIQEQKADIEKLIKLHLVDKLSNKSIAKEMGKSVDWCLRILKENNAYVRAPKVKSKKKGEKKRQHNILKDKKWKELNESSDNKVFFEEGVEYIAICKETGKTFTDFTNRSGSLTIHLRNVYPNLDIPSTRERREIYRSKKIPWHAEFFEFQKAKEKQKVACLECGWETTDHKNSGGWLTGHVRSHGISIREYVSKHPEQKHLFSTALDEEYRAVKYENKTKGVDYVECKVCGQKMSKINNTHLKKHGITLLEYKIKYGSNDGISSSSFKRKVKRSYQKGLHLYESINSSSGQQQIFDFLKDRFPDKTFLLNNKSVLKGVEIDILCVEDQIGIEFNGLYYHSEINGKKSPTYHLNKTRLMNEEGFSLIHVFEDEWMNKPDLVLSKICHIMGEKKSRRIHPRKCEIRLCKPSEKNAFLELHHIQGPDRSNIHLGAYYNEELIAVMTFDTNRQMQGSKEVELNRFCVHQSVHSPGIFGKILSYFKRNYNYKSIISFADLRWTINKENNIYTKNHFVLDKVLRPDYTYYNCSYSRNQRLTKYSFGKKSLKKKFPNSYQENLSEWEIMQLEGFDRLWDCGKLKYLLRV